MRPTALQFLAVLLGSCLSLSCPVVWATSGDEPPRFTVSAPESASSLVFVAYGDTRFTRRENVANAFARRALVDKIASESPAAILIGGDLVYLGSDPGDYEIYKSETGRWSDQQIAVFPALGNHEFKGCEDDDVRCLGNWWQAFSALALRPYRWYSVAIGPTLLALILDSDSALKPGSEQRAWFEQQITSADQRTKFILIVLHYPPVRDPFFPATRDEKEVARYLSRKARSLRARVVVVGSHVHNYERHQRDGVTYLVSGGGGAPPVPTVRMFGELSKLRTSVNYHYIRFRLETERLTGTMVRFDAADRSGNPWTEPDHFEVSAKN